MLPRFADPRRRLAWSTNTPFYQCQPSRGTARQTVNSRQPSLCGCRSTRLEYTLPTGERQHRCCHLPNKVENIDRTRWMCPILYPTTERRYRNMPRAAPNCRLLHNATQSETPLEKFMEKHRIKWEHKRAGKMPNPLINCFRRHCPRDM